MEQVIIGVDPHKLSATIEVVDAHEALLGSGRFTTDNGRLRRDAHLREGVAAVGSGRSRAPTAPAARWRSGCSRPASRSSTCRPSSSARVRLFDTGHNRKTDALDAHSIAVVAVRTAGLRVLPLDGELEALRMLADRRDELDPTPGADRVTGSSGCSANCSPDSANGTYRRCRPRRCWPPCARVTSPARPDAGSPSRSSPSWSRSMRS